jgi:hypothetical protein
MRVNITRNCRKSGQFAKPINLAAEPAPQTRVPPAQGFQSRLVASAMIRLKEACDIWSQRDDTFEIIKNLVAQASRARPFARLPPLAQRGYRNAEDRGGGFRANEVTTLGCQLRHHIFYAHATPLAVRHIQRSTGPLPAA